MAAILASVTGSSGCSNQFPSLHGFEFNPGSFELFSLILSLCEVFENSLVSILCFLSDSFWIGRLGSSKVIDSLLPRSLLFFVFTCSFYFSIWFSLFCLQNYRRLKLICCVFEVAFDFFSSNSVEDCRCRAVYVVLLFV